jgi:hypothetical protein
MRMLKCLPLVYLKLSYESSSVLRCANPHFAATRAWFLPFTALETDRTDEFIDLFLESEWSSIIVMSMVLVRRHLLVTRFDETQPCKSLGILSQISKDQQVKTANRLVE